MNLFAKLALGRRHPGKAKGVHLVDSWVCQHLVSFLTGSRFCRGYPSGSVSRYSCHSRLSVTPLRFSSLAIFGQFGLSVSRGGRPIWRNSRCSRTSSSSRPGGSGHMASPASRARNKYVEIDVLLIFRRSATARIGGSCSAAISTGCPSRQYVSLASVWTSDPRSIHEGKLPDRRSRKSR